MLEVLVLAGCYYKTICSRGAALEIDSAKGLKPLAKNIEFEFNKYFDCKMLRAANARTNSAFKTVACRDMTIWFIAAIFMHLASVGVYYCRDVRQCH